ncbi:hypothetical protein EFT87_03930 [Schleiferilactobacillus harbinensis]|uniref:hypothetical protein n=1 Tax=Schleiferilactobacillus harbinensis TaxID=304207 RepID=UPI0021A6069A|nr:hypothetical protein [Schleiferilactobacillus harbinensis]MCT2907810.1 hypothetical protein [Schleiferilactobacillus harbinensis]
MPIYYGGKKIKSLYFGGKKIASAWYGGKCVYRSLTFLTTPVQIWQRAVPGPVSSVAVDSQFNVYAGDGSGYVTKRDIYGNQVWQWGASRTVNSVAVDSQFNIYAGDYLGFITKLDSNGKQVWQGGHQ